MSKKEVENKQKEKKPRKLNLRQKKFCLEYIKSNNATQSAINAGYSKKTAEVTASKMLRIAKVKEFIKGHTKEAMEKASMKADEVIFLMTKFARQEMTEQEIHIEEFSEEGKRVIKKNKTVSLRALENLAKYLGLEVVKDNKEVSEKPLIDQFFDRVSNPAKERDIDL